MNTPQLDDDPPRVAVAVYFNGPESDQDQGGEEIPVWTVYIGDEEADNIYADGLCQCIEINTGLRTSL